MGGQCLSGRLRACIVLGGQAADWFGAGLASMVGFALFGAASCIIAIADAQATLLAGRTLQGLAAAFAEIGRAHV